MYSTCFEIQALFVLMIRYKINMLFCKNTMIIMSKCNLCTTVILIKGFTVIRYPCLSNRHDLLQGHLHTYICQPIPCNFSFTKTLKLIRTIIDVMDYYAIYYYKKKIIYIYIYI